MNAALSQPVARTGLRLVANYSNTSVLSSTAAIRTEEQLSTSMSRTPIYLARKIYIVLCCGKVTLSPPRAGKWGIGRAERENGQLIAWQLV